MGSLPVIEISSAVRMGRLVPATAIAAILLVCPLILAEPVFGQESPDAGSETTYNEIMQMIESLEDRVGKIGEPLPPETLESLEEQVEEAVRLLTSRSEENLLLRDKATGLSDELNSMAEVREDLSTKITDLEERTSLRELELRGDLETTELALAAARKLSAEKENELDRLGRQLEAVVAELAVLNASLEKSESRNIEHEKRIGELDGKLARALASKVEEMARYRSEFFGKLREVLGERQDIRIVGDRFVFQSEVLFGSGEAILGATGKEQLDRFASTLKDVAATIPIGIEWVLRVDGHTDRLPINNERFGSNWELSTARAVSVVKFLSERGIPPSRLVAAGLGEFHPLDDRNDEIAFRRNRRIEFKLTQK